MPIRKQQIYTEHFYHIYNRGVEKRITFIDNEDYYFFLKLLQYFNTTKALGRFKRYQNIDKINISATEKKPLVEILAYCLNPNHFHLILYQITDNGISKFMHQILTSYVKYFNNKYNHQGPLFSGTFKSKYIPQQSDLDYLSVYVNLNFVVHKPKLESFRLHTPPKDEQKYLSSWDEYMKKTDLKICHQEHILNNFKSREHYRKFARDKLEGIIENKKREIEK